MKEQITKFDFDAAFKALDEIEIPKVKGIRANRVNLQEACKKSDKFEALFEDYYNVSDVAEMNDAQADREEDVAQAKLARIEKIVDLDATSAEDILPSYVGKTIIQCPQCMNLFYKNPEDVEKSEEDPTIVNVNEKCQCGNISGYTLIGKVAAEEPIEEQTTEEAPPAEENTEETAEETTETEENTEDLNAEGAELGEVPAEEETEEETEEVTEESLNRSKFLKDAEKDEMNTEHHSEALTLNEQVSESLNNSEFLKDAEKDEINTENHSENLTLNEDANEVCPECGKNPCECAKDELEECGDKPLTEDARADLAAFIAGLDGGVNEDLEAEEKLAEFENNLPESDKCNECGDKPLTEDDGGVSDAEFKDMLNNPLYYEDLDKDTITEDANLDAATDAAVSKIKAIGDKYGDGADDNFEDTGMSEEDINNMSQDELEDAGAFDNLNDDEEFDEITDESLNTHISNFLTEVYSNVDKFEATACELNENKLIVEGLINFTSGRQKATKFEFEKSNNSYVGINESLANSNTFTLNYSIKDRVMTVESINYKCDIDKVLIEGCTKRV